MSNTADIALTALRAFDFHHHQYRAPYFEIQNFFLYTKPPQKTSEKDEATGVIFL